MRARESINSEGIESIVRTEIAPARPDLVIYHEGGNQFRLESLVASMPQGGKPQPMKPREPPGPAWLNVLARYSDIVRRIQVLRRLRRACRRRGSRRPSPTTRLTWPKDLSETDPDLARKGPAGVAHPDPG